tara:strand:- start:304 stop:621 length:318 start_codon:yes stop_codon:yes gene_type:complete
MSDYTGDKFNEQEAIKLLSDYIESTYGKHYSMNKIQSTEFIFDSGHGDGFCLGNIIKYAQRFGKKNGRNLDDLLKILHYGIILLGVEIENEETRKSYTSKYNQGN